MSILEFREGNVVDRKLLCNRRGFTETEIHI
jgi:hypothetical protein